MLVLSRAETESLLDLDDLRREVAAAMVEVSEGRVSMPVRTAATVPEHGGLLGVMPAYLPGMGSLMAKLVSVFPRNAGAGLPTHQAVVLVFDPTDGRPLALLDGTSITAARTAAGSALSTELCARADARVLAILGTGVQARSHATAVSRVRKFTQVRVAGRDPTKVEALVREVGGELPGVEVSAAVSLAAACRGADVVCAATHAVEPVVLRQNLDPGVHVCSVGLNPMGREVDSATVASARVIVESRAAALAPAPAGCNDLRVPIEEGVIGPDHVQAEIGELVAGSRPGRTSPEQITLYKSVGVAAQDAAAANLVLLAARAAHIGLEVEV
ncbi:MAG TPA: ornithine cyclodeaminase family protein [Candidatus Binatia bacterium]|nr:ornithine cyclodeaminase family protein [Candidatus Binatia bacterium]